MIVLPRQIMLQSPSVHSVLLKHCLHVELTVITVPAVTIVYDDIMHMFEVHRCSANLQIVALDAQLGVQIGDDMSCGVQC